MSEFKRAANERLIFTDWQILDPRALNVVPGPLTRVQSALYPVFTLPSEVRLDHSDVRLLREAAEAYLHLTTHPAGTESMIEQLRDIRRALKALAKEPPVSDPITLADLDRIDALHANRHGAVADDLLETALVEAWPAVSARLRRALATTEHGTMPASLFRREYMGEFPPPGLVFGEREKYGGRRTAVAADSATYTTTPEYSGRGGPLEREEGVALLCPDETWSTSYRSEADAIVAANAHNDARLRKGK